jgi:hypothetical protein
VRLDPGTRSVLGWLIERFGLAEFDVHCAGLLPRLTGVSQYQHQELPSADLPLPVNEALSSQRLVEQDHTRGLGAIALYPLRDHASGTGRPPSQAGSNS